MQVARNGPLTVGLQVEPPPGYSGRGARQMWEDLPSCSSFAFSYSPSGAPVGEPACYSARTCLQI